MTNGYEHFVMFSEEACRSIYQSLKKCSNVSDDVKAEHIEQVSRMR